MKKSLLQNQKNNIILGKSDSIVKYESKWPIFILDTQDKKGLWKITQNILKVLDDKKTLKEIPEEELIEYFKKNSDVDFEILFFKDIMTKHYIFKLNDKIYSYTIGQKSKRKIYARFYFDINDLLLLDLPV